MHDVALGQALALCEQANAAQKAAIALIDVIAKAWALALRRASLAETAAQKVKASATTAQAAETARGEQTPAAAA